MKFSTEKTSPAQAEQKPDRRVQMIASRKDAGMLRELCGQEGATQAQILRAALDLYFKVYKCRSLEGGADGSLVFEQSNGTRLIIL